MVAQVQMERKAEAVMAREIHLVVGQVEQSSGKDSTHDTAGRNTSLSILRGELRTSSSKQVVKREAVVVM